MFKNFTYARRRSNCFTHFLFGFSVLIGLTFVNPLYAQERPITGKVLDENKQPIPGASVLVKGTSKGKATNLKGEFSLSLAEDETTLEVSFLGYDKKEVKLDNQSTLIISLMPDEKALSEVAVTAFGMK
jgi:hypothetical protein